MIERHGALCHVQIDIVQSLLSLCLMILNSDFFFLSRYFVNARDTSFVRFSKEISISQVLSTLFSFFRERR